MAVIKNKTLKIGTVLAFSPIEKTWSVQFNDQQIQHLSYMDLCKAKKKYRNIAAKDILQWIRKPVVEERGNRLRYGTIMNFSPGDNTWSVQFGDGSSTKLTHRELCRVKRKYDGITARFRAKLDRNRLQRAKDLRKRCKPESET